MNNQCNFLFIENSLENKQQLIFKEIRSLKGSLVFYDSDLNAYNKFSGYLKAKGYKTFLWNPASDNTHRYNPFSFISNDRAMSVVEAETISSIIFSRVDYWEGNARNLLIAVLLYFNQIHERKVSTQDVLNFLLVDDVVYNIADILDNKKDLHELAYQFFAHFINKADSERSGILGCLIDKIGFLRDPYVAASTSKNDFELPKISSGKIAIFIIDNMTAKKRTEHILSVFNFQLLKLLQETELKKPLKIIYNSTHLLQKNNLFREYASLRDRLSSVYIYDNIFQMINDYRGGSSEFISYFDQVVTSDKDSFNLDKMLAKIVKVSGKLKSLDEFIKKPEELPINKQVRVPVQKLHNYQRKNEKKKKENNISYLYLIKDNTKAPAAEKVTTPEDDKPLS